MSMSDKATIEALNIELTCASEAHLHLTLDNQRMHEALEKALAAFVEAGNEEMAEAMRYGMTGERPLPAGFKLPSARPAAAAY